MQSTCDHCREPCFDEEGVSAGPLQGGLFCTPECAAAYIANHRQMTMEQKLDLHTALERKYKRRVFAAPPTRMLYYWSLKVPAPNDPRLKREQWLIQCMEKLNPEERMRALQERSRAKESVGVKFRK